MLRVAREARVEDAAHAVLTLEPGGECRGVAARAARRGRRGSGCRAGPGTPRAARASRRSRSGRARRRRSASAGPATTPGDHVAVAAEELRRRLDDEVRAELERPADVRARERVVDDVQSRRGGGRASASARVVADERRRVRDRLGVEDAGRRARRAPRATASRSVMSTMSTSTPNPPKVARGAGSASSRRSTTGATIRSPARTSDASAAWIAPIPDARATPGLAAGELGVGGAEGAAWSGWRSGCRRNRPAGRPRPGPVRRRRPRRRSRSGRSGRSSASGPGAGCATPPGWRGSRSRGRVRRRSRVGVAHGSDATPDPTRRRTSAASAARSSGIGIAGDPVLAGALRGVHRAVGADHQLVDACGRRRGSPRRRPTATAAAPPPGSSSGIARTPRRIFSARTNAPVGSVSGSSTTNSSPP